MPPRFAIGDWVKIPRGERIDPVTGRHTRSFTRGKVLDVKRAVHRRTDPATGLYEDTYRVRVDPVTGSRPRWFPEGAAEPLDPIDDLPVVLRKPRRVK
jgi:hypothetical protein